MGNFYWKYRGSQKWGVGFIMGGWEIFEVALHSWQMGASSFTSLPPATPAPIAISAVLLLRLNGWSHHVWCAIFLNDDRDLHMLNLGTLLLEGPWCMVYAVRSQVYWGLTHNVVFYWYSDLISHTQTHKTLSGQ